MDFWIFIKFTRIGVLEFLFSKNIKKLFRIFFVKSPRIFVLREYQKKNFDLFYRLD